MFWISLYLNQSSNLQFWEDHYYNPLAWMLGLINKREQKRHILKDTTKGIWESLFCLFVYTLLIIPLLRLPHCLPCHSLFILTDRAFKLESSRECHWKHWHTFRLSHLNTQYAQEEWEWTNRVIYMAGDELVQRTYIHYVFKTVANKY